MREVGVRRTAGEPTDGVERVYGLADLPALATQADALALALPHPPETNGELSAEVIARMRPWSVVVNVGRGSAVDEAALVNALQYKRIGGAGLDVTATEPPPADSPLWSLDNVILSPHTASLAADETDRLVDLFLANLDRFRAGEPLRNEVRTS
jgi:phosphoglycerate dehydrogenase-like enzyme